MAFDLGDVLGRTPARAYLQNLDTGKSAEFLFNPTEFTERYRANYARKTSPGLSHKPLHFVDCDNPTFSMTAVCDELVYARRMGKVSASDLPPRSDDDSPRNAAEWRVFMISNTTPRRSQVLKSASPAPLLLYWPKLLSVRVALVSAEIVHAMFDYTGAPRVFVAALEFEEDVQDRLFADEVLRQGTFRPWASVSAARR